LGGLALGLLEVVLEKKFTGHVHSLSKLNVTLIVLLGLISLVAHEGIWFKLQPTLTGVCLAAFVVTKKLRGGSIMLEMLRDLGQEPPLAARFYHSIEWHLSGFFVAFAGFMAFVAIYRDTATWLFWKTGGFYLAFAVFFLAELFYLRLSLRRTGP
jgi:intracellular septation protein